MPGLKERRNYSIVTSLPEDGGRKGQNTAWRVPQLRQGSSLTPRGLLHAAEQPYEIGQLRACDVERECHGL